METTKGGWSPETCIEDGVRNGAVSVMSGLAEDVVDSKIQNF